MNLGRQAATPAARLHLKAVKLLALLRIDQLDERSTISRWAPVDHATHATGSEVFFDRWPRADAQGNR